MGSGPHPTKPVRVGNFILAFAETLLPVGIFSESSGMQGGSAVRCLILMVSHVLMSPRGSPLRQNALALKVMRE